MTGEAEQLQRTPAGTPPPAAPVETWRPLVLVEGADGADDRLAALRADPGVTVTDRLDRQREELRKLRPACPPELLEEPPRWVYYPWRRTAVRLLGPQGFRRLRLDRNRNKITLEEQEQLQTRSIGVVGLSVGHAIAHTLALEGLCGHLALADFDHLELSNLNRIPATVLDLDIHKAVIAARRVAELDPYLDVSVWTEGIGTGNLDAFCEGLDILVEECDSLDVKLMVREAARRHRLPVLMETSDRGLLDVERFDLDPTRQVFHGLLDGVSAEQLRGLSTRAKAPYALRLLEADGLSARMAASMAEIDETVTTWPQLGGDVTLGAATIAAAVRRTVREPGLASGRQRIDLDEALGGIAEPDPPKHLVDVRVEREPLPDDPLTALAHAAHLAPSGGNAQPWRFVLDGERLRLHREPRASVTMDVAHRGSYLALGAALANARIAASAAGVLGEARVLPDPGDPDLAATLELGRGTDLDLAGLHDAMLTRHTNRQPGTPTALDPSDRTALAEAAEREGCGLRLLDEADTITRCAELLAESDRLRYLSPWLHAEMMREVRWPGHDDLARGIDVRTLELDATELAKLDVARRGDVMRHLADWDAGTALGEVTRDRVGTSSAVAAVTIRGDDPASYVRGGAAVERVWIAAEQAGLAVQPVSPIFLYATNEDERAELVPDRFLDPLTAVARRLRALLALEEDEQFALLLRLSHAPAATTPSGRRPFSEVIERTGVVELAT
ncbi:Rv1355c family protein [Egibacter rhizosphaerae]|uniref:Rv1355c family protein n=1 Tax=Egibacter rhizosphaerae TaxID=1670831 RepID=A0A411YLL6_9ACTN|nr:Rv1355c family protein [Egibacter rhizosphaerae]